MSNYNYGRYIGQAIDSVLNQSYPHFELLVCDDGSIDDSVAVIERYLKDSRVRLLQKENGGQATGFNAGFRIARGDIVCFLDADDLYMPTKLAHIVERMRKHPDCGCVLNPSWRVDEQLKPRGKLPLFASLPSGWRGVEVVEQGGILPYIACIPGLNLRRELANAVFPLPTTSPLNGFPDMVMMRLVPLFSRLATIEEPLAKIRLHANDTYQRSRITADSIARELEICQYLWEEQRRRLQQIGQTLADTFAPLESAPGILLQRYVGARLGGRPEYRHHRTRLLRYMRAHREPLVHQVFWWGIGFLPIAFFDGLINIAFTQNLMKQSLLMLQSLVRQCTTGPMGFHRRARTKCESVWGQATKQLFVQPSNRRASNRSLDGEK